MPQCACAGESPGLALRTAEITVPEATARRMLAFVRAQRSPYLATRADLNPGTPGPDGYVLTIEFGAPEGRSSRAVFNAVERAQPGLFAQLITVPLFHEHQILCQVAGHRMNVVKALPSLLIVRPEALDQPELGEPLPKKLPVGSNVQCRG